MSTLVERIWFGDDLLARAARMALSPAEFVYRTVVARRNRQFDDTSSRTGHNRLLPCVSVGNLTVGGTGKTPMAAWCVRRLKERGANPAVVMRGYGDDEWRVHTLLNPGTQVVVSPDRVAGVITARTRGADCAVLDDAFQHRRAPRVADLVLVGVDAWTDTVRLLPRGPYREGLEALSRATVIVLTQKSAGIDEANRVSDAVRRVVPGVAQARVRIVPGELRLAATVLDGGKRIVDRTGMLTHPLSWLANRRIVAVSAIGNPSAFEMQLRAAGATLERARRFADHHSYTASDAVQLAREASGTDGVVCTLKDAVKLAAIWPREAPPLWYVSQTVVVDRGADALDEALSRVLAARVTAMQPTR